MQDLIIQNVSKLFKSGHALDNVSLDIPPGVFGLLGPNGAGKTTLMRILTTVMEASEGQISYGTVNWKDKDKARRLIGYLPQKFSLYKHIPVKRALLHLARLKGVEGVTEEYIHKILEQVNLVDQAEKKIGALSGGMVRRVGIAQAIIGAPKVIIVDEPTAGLDPEERIRFRRLLRTLAQNTTVIISTHIVEDIEATCNHAAFLMKGKVMRSGSVLDVAQIASGKVWELRVPQAQFYEEAERWDVVSSHTTDGESILRVLAEQAPEGSISVTPTLQEGYLYLMRSTGYEGRD
ncbi:ABC transporter ATP-binding protein [Agrobacterium rhizogenes]|nr:ABC transporter ATP-binding protein [Rhizobium rhizogenes]